MIAMLLLFKYIKLLMNYIRMVVRRNAHAGTQFIFNRTITVLYKVLRKIERVTDTYSNKTSNKEILENLM